MKGYTDEEILQGCQAVFDAEHERNHVMGWEREGCLTVLENSPEIVRVEIKCMYEVPQPNLQVMTDLAEFFGTKNINDDDRFADGGCETCDYGSSYGYTLSIRPEVVT